MNKRPGAGLLTDVDISENGNISAAVSISVNGVELNIPFTTSQAEIDQRQRNKDNPNSCEREPAEDELKIPVIVFRETCLMAPHINSELRERLFRMNIRARKTGYNNVIVSKADYDECMKVKSI